MGRLAEVITTGHGSKRLPADFSVLLHKLRNFKSKDIFLIKHHCSLFDPVEKKLLYKSMHSRFTQLRKLDKTKWMAISNNIPYCKDHLKRDWHAMALKNTHLDDILRGKNVPGRQKLKKRLQILGLPLPVAYRGGAAQLLKFCRNAYEHLEDYSVSQVAHNAFVELYRPRDITYMIEHALPEVLVKFQEGFCDAGEAKSLGWHEPSGGRRLK